MLLLIPVVIAAGLSTRYARGSVPHFVTDAAGDMLYAMLATLLVGLAFYRWPRWKIFSVALLYCFAVEAAQLWHTPSLDLVRRSTMGGLILGSGFAVLDLLWYLLGAVAGISVVPHQKKITRQFRSIGEQENP